MQRQLQKLNHSTSSGFRHRGRSDSKGLILSEVEVLKFSKEKIVKSPNEAGVYIFWNTFGKPIYVGKSISLKKRIQSYLAGGLSPKTTRMISETENFSIIRVTSELEALLLEAKLVRILQPKYNSQLKDDKLPLYIKITKEKYPQVLTARRVDVAKNSLAYFGPFPSSSNVRAVLRMLRRIFPYAEHKVGKRACIYSQIGLCNPCPSEIEKLVDENLKEKLRRQYHRNINLLRQVLVGQVSQVQEKLEKQMLKLAKNLMYEEASGLRDQLEKLNYITQPKISATEFLKNPNLIEDIREEELSSLKKLISKFLPLTNLTRIECFDVAHLAGTKPTASMVTFVNGKPDKIFYRHFKIRQEKGRDDLASMAEVARRRINHLNDWGKPDLIIVDGGRTQVSIFWAKFHALNIPVVGLAKRFETLVIPYSVRTKLAFREVVVSKGHTLYFLQRIRNEAHRFARRLHHKLVEKELIPNK